MSKNTNSAPFAVASIVRRADKRYRVIAIAPKDVILCELDITSFKLSSIPLSDFTDMLRDGLFVVEADDDDGFVFDVEKLNPKIRADYENNLAVITEVEAAYGPYYLGLCIEKKKPDVERIIKAYGISRKKFWRIVREYFQNGMKKSALVDKRAFSTNKGMRYKYKKKPGRKSEYFDSRGVVPSGEHMAHMMDALEKFKSGGCLSIMDAYNYMNDKYYRAARVVGNDTLYDLVPESQRPTYKQLYGLITSHLTKEEIRTLKTTAREVRNNERILLSTSDHDARGPGDLVEIDACEANVSLVSVEDKDRCVSRPTVYFLTDTYSRCINAVSVDYRQNSDQGITNLLLNLGDDKREYAAKFNIIFDNPLLWPSNFLPRRARLDHGSEMQSQFFTGVCNKLGIQAEHVAPASGSLKGVVEQEFRLLEQRLAPHLKGYGLIDMKYGTEYHREATLDINSYTELVVRFVLEWNEHQLSHYRRTKDMREKGVVPSPAGLWRYGVEKYGAPRPITDMDQYIYTLMMPIKAKINRHGITYKGKFYLPVDDPYVMERMFDAGDRKEDFPAKWDERDIGEICYERDRKLYKAVLNPDIPGNADEAGLPEAEWDAARKIDGKMNAEGQIRNEKLAAFNYGENAATVAAAKKDTYSDTKNVREARAAEREITAANNKLADRMTGVPRLPKSKKPEKEPRHYDSLDDALDELEE